MTPFRPAALCVAAVFGASAVILTVQPAQAQSIAQMTVVLDATQAPRKIFHVQVTMPAIPGAFTFVYPKWIPGYHSSTGPIEDVVNLHVSANGTALAWRRDLVDFYAFHTSVPQGANRLSVDFDVVGAPSNTAELSPVTSPNIAILEYSCFVMYPQGAVASDLSVEASLKLPDEWDFGTALPVRARNGANVAFASVPLSMLVDSPIEAGRFFRAFPLGGEHELDLAADSEAALAIDSRVLGGLKHLVVEGPALYGDKHYRDYHFLLSLSETIEFEGVEHHESSDNRASEQYVVDPENFRDFPDLLSHEYSHSWNGKYRRPADLFVPNYQAPELTDLLWVYEGLNEYVGQLLSTRARMNVFGDELDSLARAAASMDYERGRDWRPLQDTADFAPLGFFSPAPYNARRRNAGDFYTEGNLIWLEADVRIRRLSHGSKSLDDFLKLWAAGGSTTPSVKTYVAADVVSLLNQVVAYDWAGFFRERVGQVRVRAPLDGITLGGYRLVFNDTVPRAFERSESEGEGGHKRTDLRYSLGFTLTSDSGVILDVLPDSPAAKAGLAPSMQILAVNGRKWSVELLHRAIKSAKGGTAPIQLIVSN
ncbi:MAG TPA: hypothetical protein VKG44_05335, partial [Candidatus Baltobacteraceae bacterium]|nr:hypothetical protein [Candidatus Baltobacteraceae bacterium]